ncbi:MAG: ORF6N domain-containing protein [Candidatus Margulisiibacteriota bacterium]
MDKMIPIERVESRIYLIRGEKVMLDRDLAELYGVPTKRLNEAVKRNIQRFPEGFMYILTKDEAKNLKSQITTSSSRSQIATLKRGYNIKYLPYVFTEHGVAMLSSVLNSERAIQVNIMIIKAFIRLRQVLADNKELADKFRELESRVDCHDGALAEIIDRIRELMTPVRTNVIGFDMPTHNVKGGEK